MRMSDFAGNLPRTFKSFLCLEKESKLQGWSQAEKDQQPVISHPIAVADMIEIPGTDTSHVKTTTILRSVQRGINVSEGVRNMSVDAVGSVQSNANSDVNAYCEDKLRSLSQDELQTLAKGREESLAKTLGCLGVSGGVVDEPMHVDVTGVLEKAGHHTTLVTM